MSNSVTNSVTNPISSPVANKTPDKPTFFDNIKKKGKDFCQNKLIMQIAIGILSVMIGLGVGALVGSAFTASTIIIGAAVGAIVGGFTYAAVKGVQHVIRKKAYPAHEHTKMTKKEKEEAEENKTGKIKRKPIATDWRSDDHLLIFKDVVKEHFSEKPWFIAWKKHKGFKHDDRAAEYLFGKWMPMGLSFGEAGELLRISKTDPKLQKDDLLNKVRAENLFLRQIPEFVREDLELNPALGTLLNDVAAEASNIPDLELRSTLKINLKNFTSFESDLKQHLNTDLGATLQFEGKKKPTLFIRLQKPYSFYDPFSKKFGGLHENFKSPDDFVKKLASHLECYRSKWRTYKPLKTGIIKFYR